MSLPRDRGGGSAPTGWSTATIRPPDLLLGSDLTRTALGELLNLAARMKSEPAGWRDALPGESLVSFFERPSTVAHTSLEAAAHRLGLLPVRLAPDELPVADGETIDDTVRILSSYAAAIAVRAFSHLTQRRIARAATVPVVHALSEEQDRARRWPTCSRCASGSAAWRGSCSPTSESSATSPARSWRPARWQRWTCASPARPTWRPRRRSSAPGGRRSTPSSTSTTPPRDLAVGRRARRDTAGVGAYDGDASRTWAARARWRRAQRDAAGVGGATATPAGRGLGRGLWARWRAGRGL